MRFRAIASTVVFSLLCAFPISAQIQVGNTSDPPVKITPIRDRASGRVVGDQWYISKPLVNVKQHEYPELRYYPGDMLFIQAGGCVQTGGMGATCHSYTDPKGPNSEKYYSGTLWIPGAVGPAGAGYTRIKPSLNKPLVIPKTASGARPDNFFLHLGYEDDNYTDNGYWGMDAGPDGYVQGEGWAWVRVTVTYNYGSVSPARPAAPMDLWWDTIDDNSLPLNPKWGLQVTHGQVPNADALCGHFSDSQTHGCTTWYPTIDEAGTFSVCQFAHFLQNVVHGHINWGYATYEGRIFFDDFNRWPGDGDYSMLLVRDDEAGATTGNTKIDGRHALVLEFDTGETIDFFVTKWWSDFHSAVDKGAPPIGGIGLPSDYSEAKAMVDGREAIAIGQIGIDNQHDAQAELHPIHGLAIHTGASAMEDVWQLFARNSGNEGSCSQNQHFFPQNEVSFFFENTIAVDESTTEFHANVAAATSWSWKQVAKGVVLTFFLPEPQSKAVVHGELHLKRNTLVKPKIVRALPRDKNDDYRRLFRSLISPEDGNEIWEQMLNKMPKDQQRRFLVACQDLQRREYQRNRAVNQKIPKGNLPVQAKRKALTDNDARAPAQEIISTRSREPFDKDLEQRRINIFRTLERAVGNREDFERLLRQTVEANRKDSRRENGNRAKDASH